MKSLFLTLILIFLTSSASFAEQSLFLQKNQVIQGIPCKKGQVWLYDSGTLMSAHLSKAIKINDLICTRLIELYESGKIKHTVFPKDQVYQGVPVLGNYSVKFYENGKLQMAFLSKEFTVEGYLFPRETILDFYESGKIKHALHQKRKIVVGGITFPKFSHLFFDESGKLQPAPK